MKVKRISQTDCLQTVILLSMAIFEDENARNMSNPIQQLHDSIELHPEFTWNSKTVLKRMEIIKHKDTADQRLFYVSSGSLRICWDDEATEHTIRFGYAGSFVTDLEAYITNAPSPYYIQALKQCEVKIISKERFVKVLESDEALGQLWVQILQELVYQQMERELDLLTASPQKRYERVLQRSPKVFQEIPHKYIAHYLRMAPETLSRLKKS